MLLNARVTGNYPKVTFFTTFSTTWVWAWWAGMIIGAAMNSLTWLLLSSHISTWGSCALSHSISFFRVLAASFGLG